MFGKRQKIEQAPQPVVQQPDPIRADLLRRMQTTWNGAAGLKLQQELAAYDGGMTTTEATIVNLTRGRLAVYMSGRRVWLGTQDEWAEARRVRDEVNAKQSATTNEEA